MKAVKSNFDYQAVAIVMLVTYVPAKFMFKWYAQNLTV